MSGQHTQGRITVGQVDDLFVVGVGADLPASPGRYCVAALIRKEVDARRLAACWNACEGLSTERLESLKVSLPTALHEAERDRAKLRAKIDAASELQTQLVEALSELTRECKMHTGWPSELSTYTKATTALTAAGAQP